jgi:hypothetical protein
MVAGQAEDVSDAFEFQRSANEVTSRNLGHLDSFQLMQRRWKSSAPSTAIQPLYFPLALCGSPASKNHPSA